MRNSNIELLRIVAMLAIVGVFAVCSALDYLRIRFLERLVFRGLSAKV